MCGPEFKSHYLLKENVDHIDMENRIMVTRDWSGEEKLIKECQVTVRKKE
jgi:hypothetical protein